MFSVKYTDPRGNVRFGIYAIGDRQIRQLVPFYDEPVIGEDDVVVRNMQQLIIGNIIPWDTNATNLVEIIVLKRSYFVSGRIAHLVGLGELYYIKDENVPEEYRTVFSDSRLERRGFSLNGEKALLTNYLAKFRIVNSTRKQLSQAKGYDCWVDHQEVSEEIIQEIVDKYPHIEGTTQIGWSVASIDRIMQEHDSFQHEVILEDTVYEILTVAPLSNLIDIFCPCMFWSPGFRNRFGDLLADGGREYVVVLDPSSPYHDRSRAIRIKIFKASRRIRFHFYIRRPRMRENNGNLDPLGPSSA
jgi:hypothetical protein